MPSLLLAKTRIYVLLLQFSVLAFYHYRMVSHVVAFRGRFLMVACFHLGACRGGGRSFVMVRPKGEGMGPPKIFENQPLILNLGHFSVIVGSKKKLQFSLHN